jgi:hypothetical protein
MRLQRYEIISPLSIEKIIKILLDKVDNPWGVLPRNAPLHGYVYEDGFKLIIQSTALLDRRPATIIYGQFEKLENGTLIKIKVTLEKFYRIFLFIMTSMFLSVIFIPNRHIDWLFGAFIMIMLSLIWSEVFYTPKYVDEKKELLKKLITSSKPAGCEKT